ncbi:MAG: hypothetical protein M3430_20675 [Acidobacteriota bacterium]|nr:hypothetical protein [Acidobacteriota bacterium]
MVTTAPVAAEIGHTPEKSKSGLSDAGAAARNALARATKEPKEFKRWTAPRHGISLSTASRDVGEFTRVLVVAVRNTNREAVRVLPGHPEMFVETSGGDNRPVLIEWVRKLHTETTTLSNVVPAGAVVYYALGYESPILGAKQHLRVAVGHRNAADEPASSDLTTADR